MVELLTLPDQTIAYLDRDPGTPAVPLVLLHGGAVDRRMWDRQVDAFPERRLLVPDARGHGGSSDASAPYRLCDDVVALLDALGIERAVLVGLSMGGGMAVDTALEHPGRVAALVVSGTGSSEPEFTDPFSLRYLEDRATAEAAGDAEAWIAAHLRFVPGPHRTVADVEPAVYAAVETMLWDTIRGHVVADEDGVPRIPPQPIGVPDTWARMPGITAPVLGIAGGADAADHIAMPRRLAESVPTGRFVTVPDTGHYPNMERPAEFTAAVRGFLADLDG
jgi:pimeloyl-ACP methyl ester carboxylesterase